MAGSLWAIALLTSLFSVQGSPAADVWRPLEHLVGSWQGTGKGEPGVSRVERSYERVLNGKFIYVKNKSIYEPQPKNPRGEVHEDWSLISYDLTRKQFVMRQFHVEGFVNQYVLEKMDSEGRNFVFSSEAIENIAPGWRARESYKILNEDEFIETFELAPPGKDFATYTENHFKRKPGTR